MRIGSGEDEQYVAEVSNPQLKLCLGVTIGKSLSFHNFYIPHFTAVNFLVCQLSVHSTCILVQKFF